MTDDSLIDNPRAFPLFIPEGHFNGSVDVPGMTLRDYFAAAIIQGIATRIWDLTDNNTGKRPKWASLADQAYSGADAMLKARAND